MHINFRALPALGLSVGLLVGAVAPTLGAEAPRTVSDYYNAINDAVAHLNKQVTERQKSGEMDKAQRLVLVTEMVRRAGEEFRGAEQDSLPESASGLPAPVPALLDAALAKAKEAERVAVDNPAFVDDAQHTFNALIDRLPVRSPHPILYGLLSNDLAKPGPPLTSDVIIYGYRLIDPFSKSRPVIYYGPDGLPAASLAITDTQIGVTLPDDVKKAVNFAPPPCDPRPSFGLRVSETYARVRGAWPISWHEDTLSNTDLYALPTPRIYTAAIDANIETAAGHTTTVDFDERSEFALADCGKTKAVDIKLPLPDKAKDVRCNADWIDTSGTTKRVTQCRVEGQTIHAHGEILGNPPTCSPPPDPLCTCSVLAQGWLEAKGNYRAEAAVTQVKTTADASTTTFASGNVRELRLPVKDGQKLRHVFLKVSRLDCPDVVDEIDVTIGNDPNATANGVSKTGAFRATVHDGVLRIGAADIFAEDIGKAPGP